MTRLPHAGVNKLTLRVLLAHYWVTRYLLCLQLYCISVILFFYVILILPSHKKAIKQQNKHERITVILTIVFFFIGLFSTFTTQAAVGACAGYDATMYDPNTSGGR